LETNMPGSAVTDYPDFTPLDMGMRPELHRAFWPLATGISEHTFAGIYLFRRAHGYEVSRLGDGSFVFSGSDAGGEFFMLPFGLPAEDVLSELFDRFGTLRAAPAGMARALEEMGYEAATDRDNFDYLYLREKMATFAGRKLHRKKNLVNRFKGEYEYEGRPLLDEYIPDAIGVLERWRDGRAPGDGPGDYGEALEALEHAYELQLCGGIYYVDNEPAAYTLGEELTPDTFVIHFEKAAGGFTGLYQFVEQSFAAILPEKYTYINREQDLGEPGLRAAKESLVPAGFVEKYIVRRKGAA